MAKTFIPTMYQMVKQLAIYMTRYRDTMERYMSDEEVAAINQLIIALNVVLQVIEITQNP